MDRFGEHIDNKFGGCDIPYNGETKQQTIGQAIQAAYERIEPLAVAIRANLMPVIRNIINVAKNISNRIMHEYPNKRVVHLAYHGKKARTRKKNSRRIVQWLQTGEVNND